MGTTKGYDEYSLDVGRRYGIECTVWTAGRAAPSKAVE